jgi:hypothetical protein
MQTPSSPDLQPFERAKNSRVSPLLEHLAHLVLKSGKHGFSRRVFHP